jgi:hypothetical protein
MHSVKTIPTYRSKGKQGIFNEKDTFRGRTTFFVASEIFRIWPETNFTQNVQAININAPVWNVLTADAPFNFLPFGGDLPGVYQFPLEVLDGNHRCSFSAKCSWKATYTGIFHKTCHIEVQRDTHTWIPEQRVPPGPDMETPEEDEETEIFNFEFNLFLGEWFSPPGTSVKISQFHLGEPEALLLPIYTINALTGLLELDYTFLQAK